MLILINGAAGTGKSTLAGRLSEALALEPPAWPIRPEAFEQFRRIASGWMEVGTDYFAAERHINMDKLVALAMVNNMDRLPPLPDAPDQDPESARQWVGASIQSVAAGKLMPRFFQLLCEMIDAREHAIVEGTNLGHRAFDAPTARMLLFKYGHRGVAQITASRQPYDGPQLDPDATYEWSVSFQGKAYEHDALLGLFERTAEGDVSIAAPSP